MITTTQIKNKLAEGIEDILIVYPGRFQPFGPHHYQAYDMLCNEYGDSNVHIVTTNKVESPNSPFTYQQKTQIMEKFGINKYQITEVKMPYSPIELIRKYDYNTTALFYALGSKDIDRIKSHKVDGSATYIQKNESVNKFNSLNKNAYIIELPHINIDLGILGECSGTNLRKLFLSKDKNKFREVMGWYDESITNMIFETIEKTQIQEAKQVDFSKLVMPFYLK